MPSLFPTGVVRAGFLREGQLFPKGRELGPEGDSSPGHAPAVDAAPQALAVEGRDNGCNKVHPGLLTWEGMNRGQGPSRSSRQELEEGTQRDKAVMYSWGTPTQRQCCCGQWGRA